uniref:Uncharacterized protein n=1 Tax=Salix viminalis TaxID=40686 RepID=A0A6N2M2Q2_SALVM
MPETKYVYRLEQLASFEEFCSLMAFMSRDNLLSVNQSYFIFLFFFPFIKKIFKAPDPRT